ncbi:MAG: cell division ATP-binding protein FtsE [Myxococcales bacterium]|nr:cell division ATP-binding protein FtsE [Myxococcales bacterium]
MIELYHVTKRYPNGVSALTDIDVAVQAGEFCFLAGPSGAGKSTFIRLLLCIEPATEGQILIKGRNLRMLRPASIPYLRRNMGVVFQNFRLLPHRNVFDNVAIALEILGISRREIVPRVEQTLDMVGLSDFDRHMPQMLSGGEQQRVAIARALVNEPAILLADEPTGNLDPTLSLEILNIFSDIHRRGATVIFATHDVTLLDRVPARILSLNRGYLVSDSGARFVQRDTTDAVPGTAASDTPGFED